MARIVECVPNFSEGQHKEVVEAIANAISSTDGCNLLDVDPGASTNRTVFTFVGSPEAVVEGALNAARVAAHYIDMTKHHGEHPRLGALDVCPFIPVQGVTMEECIECAKEFGERLAMELGVPVYLYGEASDDLTRKSVPQIRAGEYEGLPDKLSKPEWKPNFGPADFVPNWGATIAGARKFLIAYNVNLLSTKEQAHRIALNIREQGRGDTQPGRLKKVQAIGWYLEEANMAQVSVNILDFETTPIHVAFEEICKDAEEMNLAVCGSQIVGLVPLKAIMDCAEYYMKKENLFILEDDQKIRLVVDRLGLHSLGGFSPKERIIEFMTTEEKYGPLVLLDVKDFVFTVGARSPSPGGGSVAALSASMGAALSAMAGFLTYGNKKYAPLDAKMRELLPGIYSTMKDLVPYVDHDAAAFGDYMALKVLFNPEEYENGEGEEAMKKSKKNAEEEAFGFASGDVVGKKTEDHWREEAMQRALRAAVDVPMMVAKKANSVWPSLKELAKIFNINCKSDLQVGVKCLETGVYGAYCNVVINLKDIKDEKLKAKLQKDIESELKTAQDGCAEVLKIVEERKE